MLVWVSSAQIKLFLDVKPCVFDKHFSASTVFNSVYCKVVAYILSVTDTRPKPIVITSVAVAVGEQTNGTGCMYSEHDTIDGNLIRATSL